MEKIIENLGEIAREIVEDHTDCDIYHFVPPLLKCNFVIRSGTLGIFFQLLLVIGILYAYCCGYARNVVTTTGLCLVGPILFVIMMIFMPESPMFYMVKRNEEAAKKSMRFFRGPDYEDIDDELAIFKVSVLFYLIFSISSQIPLSHRRQSLLL